MGSVRISSQTTLISEIDFPINFSLILFQNFLFFEELCTAYVTDWKQKTVLISI